MLLAQLILGALGIYASVGVVFAVLFVSRGVERIDEAARGAPIGFRVLIFPASAALWPALWHKWHRARTAKAA